MNYSIETAFGSAEISANEQVVAIVPTSKDSCTIRFQSGVTIESSWSVEQARSYLSTHPVGVITQLRQNWIGEFHGEYAFKQLFLYGSNVDIDYSDGFVYSSNEIPGVAGTPVRYEHGGSQELLRSKAVGVVTSFANIMAIQTVVVSEAGVATSLRVEGVIRQYVTSENPKLVTVVGEVVVKGPVTEALVVDTFIKAFEAKCEKECYTLVPALPSYAPSGSLFRKHFERGWHCTRDGELVRASMSDEDSTYIDSTSFWKFLAECDLTRIFTQFHQTGDYFIFANCDQDVTHKNFMYNRVTLSAQEYEARFNAFNSDCAARAARTLALEVARVHAESRIVASKNVASALRYIGDSVSGSINNVAGALSHGLDGLAVSTERASLNVGDATLGRSMRYGAKLSM